MEIFNWWKRWKKGDPVCKVASAQALNRVYNVLEGLEVFGINGIDAQINKPTDAEGRGWTITIDGWPITRTGAGRMMPFDIVKRGNGHYAVYVGSSSALEINDSNNQTTCDSVIDIDGYIDLGTTASGAWLYVRVIQDSGEHPEYRWGVLSAYPSQNVNARYVAIWQIGAMSAGVISQYWRGRIRIADATPDGMSIERNADKGGWYGLQLYHFAAGLTSSPSIGDADFLIRVKSSDGYVLRYMSGDTLASIIRDIVVSIVTQKIGDMTDRDTQIGAQFMNELDGVYQQTVRADTTTDGTDSGTYYGIPPNGQGAEWQPT